jgi:hypothetical protein
MSYEQRNIKLLDSTLATGSPRFITPRMDAQIIEMMHLVEKINCVGKKRQGLLEPDPVFHFW